MLNANFVRVLMQIVAYYPLEQTKSRIVPFTCFSDIASPLASASTFLVFETCGFETNGNFIPYIKEIPQRLLLLFWQKFVRWATSACALSMCIRRFRAKFKYWILKYSNFVFILSEKIFIILTWIRFNFWKNLTSKLFKEHV